MVNCQAPHPTMARTGRTSHDHRAWSFPIDHATVHRMKRLKMRAGVLLAIPALGASDVLPVARQIYGSIGPAFYGLRTTLAVSYTHLRAHETRHDLVCRLLLEKK